MKARVLLALIGGLTAALILVFWRGFFPQHAAIIGVAVAALIYSIFRTRDRLQGIYRR